MESKGLANANATAAKALPVESKTIAKKTTSANVLWSKMKKQMDTPTNVRLLPAQPGKGNPTRAPMGSLILMRAEKNRNDTGLELSGMLTLASNTHPCCISGSTSDGAAKFSYMFSMKKTVPQTDLTQSATRLANEYTAERDPQDPSGDSIGFVVSGEHRATVWGPAPGTLGLFNLGQRVQVKSVNVSFKHQNKDNEMTAYMNSTVDGTKLQLNTTGQVQQKDFLEVGRFIIQIAHDDAINAVSSVRLARGIGFFSEESAHEGLGATATAQLVRQNSALRAELASQLKGNGERILADTAHGDVFVAFYFFALAARLCDQRAVSTLLALFDRAKEILQTNEAGGNDALNGIAKAIPSLKSKINHAATLDSSEHQTVDFAVLVDHVNTHLVDTLARPAHEHPLGNDVESSLFVCMPSTDRHQAPTRFVEMLNGTFRGNTIPELSVAKVVVETNSPTIAKVELRGSLVPDVRLAVQGLSQEDASAIFTPTESPLAIVKMYTPRIAVTCGIMHKPTFDALLAELLSAATWCSFVPIFARQSSTAHLPDECNFASMFNMDMHRTIACAGMEVTQDWVQRVFNSGKVLMKPLAANEDRVDCKNVDLSATPLPTLLQNGFVNIREMVQQARIELLNEIAADEGYTIKWFFVAPGLRAKRLSCDTEVDNINGVPSLMPPGEVTERMEMVTQFVEETSCLSTSVVYAVMTNETILRHITDE